MNPNWHEIIQRHMAGLTSDEEAAALQELLKHDDNAARLYLRYANLDMALESKASSMDATRELLTRPIMSRSPRWPSWRPLTAAAAGLVIGCFSTSVVWAYAKQAQFADSRRLTLPLTNPGFEQQAALPQSLLVPVSGQWSGVGAQIVAGGGDLPIPKGGKRMIRLESDLSGQANSVNLIVDLQSSRPSSAEGLQIQIGAFYHASVPDQKEHYSLRAITFIQDTPEVAARWGATPWRTMNEEALSLSVRAVFPNPAETGWRPIAVRLDVPPQARTLVISLSANTPGPPEDNTVHFVDEVRAVWLIPDAEPVP